MGGAGVGGAGPCALDLFGEGPSRVVLCVADGDVAEILRRAGESGLSADMVGRSGGDRVVIRGAFDVDLGDLTAAWSGTLPALLAPGGIDGH